MEQFDSLDVTPKASTALTTTLSEFSADILENSEDTTTTYIVTKSTVVSSSNRTSALTLYIMPGAQLRITGTVTLTQGLLKIICWGTLRIINTLILSAGSVIDGSKAESLNLYNMFSVLKLGKGATLILGDTLIKTNSGTVNQKAKIIGDESVLVAPPVQIFDERISVEGTWAIDCAYPQWFTTATTFNSVDAACDATTKPDWAPAINKAIKMKNSGLVSLPRGVYIIKSTIFTHLGIRLVGEGASSRKLTTEDDQKNPVTIFEITGTVLMADLSARDNFAKGNYRVKWIDSNSSSDPNTFKNDVDSSEPYMMALNFESEYSVIRDSDDSIKIPDLKQPSNILITSSNTPAIIEYIYFTTSRKPHKQIPADEEINAIYAIGYFSFRNLVFHGIGTALYILPQYSDCQELIDCHYYRPWKANAITDKSPEEVDRFAICRLGSGDAFRMEGCHIIGHSTIGSVYLNKCFGGSLMSNIFNSHVVISGCQNIIYSGNHSEYGSQLMLLCSTVDASANYFEKGKYPTVRLFGNLHQDFSVLNLSTSKFIFCDGPRFAIEKKDKTNLSDLTWLSNLKERFESMNPYDIEIDDISILTLNQNYRGLQLLGNDNSIPKGHTYGLFMGKTTISNRNALAFDEFNKKSGFLTPGCQIARNAVISSATLIPDTPGNLTVTYAPKLSSQIQWTGPLTTDTQTISISYKAALLSFNETIDDNLSHEFKDLGENTTPQKEIIRNLKDVTYTDSNKVIQNIQQDSLEGILFIISAPTYQNRGKLCVVRQIKCTKYGVTTKTTDVVYMPLCFSTMCYDNGVTLSSFKWQPTSINFDSL